MISVIYETVQFLMGVIDSPEKEKKKKIFKKWKGGQKYIVTYYYSQNRNYSK